MLEIEQSLGSNVCRCTGYRPILEAFKKFAKDSLEKQILDIEDLYVCKKPGTSRDKSKNCNEDWCMVEKDDVADFSIIELKLKDGKYWYRVVEVKNIFEILQEKGDDSYMLVAGNTAKGKQTRNNFIIVTTDTFKKTNRIIYLSFNILWVNGTFK